MHFILNFNTIAILGKRRLQFFALIFAVLLPKQFLLLSVFL